MTTHREFCVEICDKTIAASHEVAAGQTDKEKQRKTFLKISTLWSFLHNALIFKGRHNKTILPAD